MLTEENGGVPGLALFEDWVIRDNFLVVTKIRTRGLAHPFPPLTPEGAPSLSRFPRQGGDFDFLNAGIPRSEKSNPAAKPW
jgi:hypothetical protein